MTIAAKQFFTEWGWSLQSVQQAIQYLASKLSQVENQKFFSTLLPDLTKNSFPITDGRRCFICRSKFSEKITTQAGRPVIWRHPLWPNHPFCDACSTLPRCMICERRTPPRTTIRERISPGAISLNLSSPSMKPVNTCSLCHCSGSVNTPAEAEIQLEGLLDSLAKDPLILMDFARLSERLDFIVPGASSKAQQRLRGGRRVLVSLVGSSHLVGTGMHARRQKGGGLVFGRCESLKTGVGKENTAERKGALVKQRAVHQILMLDGLQQDVFVSTLAHELTHAYISTVGYCIPPLAEEGLCNAVCIYVLYQRFQMYQSRGGGAGARVAFCRDLCHFRIKRMLLGDIPEYKAAVMLLPFLFKFGLGTMATLEKLGILGIRSFSPESLEVLTFEKPLTLIVGHNGAGKTTIVECLKMATTGELPPNCNKGQYFIHNLSGENSETKGQIRLVFAARSQQKVLVSRSFQLLTSRDRKGKSKSSYKALDSVLQVKDSDGTTKSISKKCIQMDQQVPMLLGVSKAVLENVVFCHQDESNWPLGEMAKLKKKFDDLFGATRYSKALEAISTLKKDHQKIGKEKLHQSDLLAMHAEQAASVRKKISNAREAAAAVRDEIEVLKSRRSQYEAELATATSELSALRESEIELAVKKRQLLSLEMTIENLHQNLEEVYTETEEELAQCKAELETKVTTLTETAAQEERDLEKLGAELASAESKRRELQNKSLEAVRAAERLAEALRAKENIEQRWRSEGLGNVVGGADGDGRLSELEKKFGEARRRLTRCLEGRELCENAHSAAMQESWQNASAQRSAEQEISTLQAQLVTTRAGLDDEARSLDEIEQSLVAPDQEDLEASEAALRNTLTCAEERLVSLKQERVVLAAEVDETTREAQELGQMDSLQQRIVAEEEALKKLGAETAKGREECAAEAGGSGVELDEKSLKNGTAKNAVASALAQCREADARLKRGASEQQEKVGQALGSSKMLQNELARLKKEKDKLEGVLRGAGVLTDHRSAVEAYEEAVATQRALAEQATKELLVAQNADTLYTNYLQHSLSRNKCAFCTRVFVTPQEKEALKHHLSARINKLPETISANKAAADEARAKLQELEELRGVVSALNTTSSRLPDLEEKAKSTADLLSRLKIRMERFHDERNQSENKIENLSRLLYRLEVLERDHQKVEEIRSRIVKLKSQAKEASSKGSPKESMDTWKTRLMAAQKLLKFKEKEIEETEKECLNFRQQLADFLQTRSALDARRRALELEQKRAAEMAARQNNQKINLKKLIESVKLTLKPQEERTLQDLERAKAQYRAAEEEHAEAQDRVRRYAEIRASLEREWAEIEARIAEARRMEDGAKSVTLEKVNEAVATADRLFGELQRKRQKLVVIREELSEQQRYLCLVRSNLEVKTKEAELMKLRSELEKANVREAEVRLEEAKKKCDDLMSNTSLLSNEMSAKSGEIKSHEKWIEQVSVELENVRFKEIDKRFKESKVETELELMVIRDLHKYHTALDKGLMRYHRMKMQEVNRSIRQLWQTIYRGRDIDYIAIRSDTDEDLQQLNTGQRSYNYRVTMMKEGLELEMRGRCSAGQKVLASIIIRLAIAESFSLDCGTLTLDEPTTNLDHDNMKALAKALANLIEARRNSPNFQLILITHDEEFVRMLARHQPCDCFFEVTKDNQGFSIIKRADIKTF